MTGNQSGRLWLRMSGRQPPMRRALVQLPGCSLHAKVSLGKRHLAYGSLCHQYMDVFVNADLCYKVL